MTSLVLYDDGVARGFEPFALTRPVCEVRAGARTIRERWLLATRAASAGFASSPHLKTFDEAAGVRAARRTLPAGTIVANARFAPALGAALHLAPGESALHGTTVVAVSLGERLDAAALADGTLDLRALPARRGPRVAGWWLEQAWDVIGLLPQMLAADAAFLAAGARSEPPPHVTVLGAHRLASDAGAYFEPHVVIDTTAGDVVIAAGVRVGAFARIAGPAVIDEGTQVAGGRYACVSVGPHSRVCGEMNVVVVGGYANKAHDGFVGHSALGRWVNLGAGTTTSNLKNSYGPVRVRDGRGDHDTGLQFLGSLIGDHAKTAIGTRLMTGTIVGAGANVFGDRSPEKHVPPFAWGDREPFARYETTKFLAVARHVMSRRHVRLSAGMRAALAAAADIGAVRPPPARGATHIRSAGRPATRKR